MNLASNSRLKIKTMADETFLDEINQRKIPKTPSQHLPASRRRSIVRDDFTKLCIQDPNGWVINKEFESMLLQHNQLFVIGIIGEVDECRGFIETVVKQNICIYNHEEEGIFMSKPFFINKEWKVPVAFLISTFKEASSNASKFEFITAMLSHSLIIFDWTANLQRLSRFNDTFRTNEKRLDKLLEVSQTVLVICYENNSKYQVPSQGMDDNLLQWGIIEIRAKVDLAQKEQTILQYLFHSMKKNYATLSSYLAIGYYHLFSSIWAQIKSAPYRIEIHKFIDNYVESVEKHVRSQYQNLISENFQENKDDIFLYQCLKSFKQTHKKRFEKLTFFCRKESAMAQRRLTKLFNETEESTVKYNNQLNYAKNLKIAEDCQSKIKREMIQKVYNTKNLSTTYSDDFSKFLSQYQVRSLGASNGEALKHWMSGYNKKIEGYFTEVITTDLSRSVAKSHDQSKDDLIERIALTQGMLSTVQKQLISLQRRRDGLEKESNNKKAAIENIRKSLRETKERIKVDEEHQRKERHKTKSVDPKGMISMEMQGKETKKRKRWLCFG